MTVNKNGAKIILEDGREYSTSVITDNMGEKSIDITGLRKETGYITEEVMPTLQEWRANPSELRNDLK